MTTWFYLFIVIACIYLVKTSRKRREVSVANAQRFIKKEQYDRAEDLLREMIGRGSPEAMLVLTDMYMKIGRGKDAADLLEKFSDNGYQPAGQMLAALYWEGKGVSRDPAKAIEVLTPLAENGDAYSQYMLGHYYRENGNPGKGKEWLRLAAKNGSHDAHKELEEMG